MNIAVLDHNTLTVGDIDFSPIEKLGNVTYFDAMPTEKLAEALKDTDAALINKAQMTREVISSLPRLKYIGLFATGYNNVDLSAANDYGVTVVNAPGYSTDSVAQLVFAFILSLAVNIGDYNASVHRGEWIYSPTFAYFPYQITELTGKTLGIIGFGAIGSKVAKIGDALGMNVIVHTRTVKEGVPYKFVSREEVFRESDFLSLNCPLTDATANIVCKDTIALMKSGACVINTARGGCVNSADLAEALNSGRLRGAGIDTLVKEPMSADDPLFSAKNCIITPHIAWASLEARTRLITMVADSLRLWQEGTPRYVVNNK